MGGHGACLRSLLREFEGIRIADPGEEERGCGGKSVAERLGNTPAVCRKCYVHPAVIETYMGGEMLKSFEDEVKRALPPHRAAAPGRARSAAPAGAPREDGSMIRPSLDWIQRQNSFTDGGSAFFPDLTSASLL